MITNLSCTRLISWAPAPEFVPTGSKWDMWSAVGRLAGSKTHRGLQITRGEHHATHTIAWIANLRSCNKSKHVMIFGKRSYPVHESPSALDTSISFQPLTLHSPFVSTEQALVLAMATEISQVYRIHLHERGPTSAEGIKRNLKLEELPKPQPATGQILVRMKAAALNCG